MPRNDDVGEELHAAGDRSTVRPDASHAAYFRHSATSAISISGNSSTICSAVWPAARCLSTSDTEIRSPRTQACPLQTRGSTVIRGNADGMQTNVSDRIAYGNYGPEASAGKRSPPNYAIRLAHATGWRAQLGDNEIGTIEVLP